MSDLELAIRGKLERNEALDVQERTHLMKLWRETSKLKAPLIVELLKGDLEGVEKIVVFAIFRETIDIICKGLGDIAAAIHGGTPQRDRQRLIDSFQTEDRPRVLVLQLHVGGTAITLHRY